MESGLTAKQEAAPNPAFAFARVFIAEGTTPLVTVSLRLEKPFSSQMISLSGHVMTPSALHTPVNVIKRSSSEKAQPTTFGVQASTSLVCRARRRLNRRCSLSGCLRVTQSRKCRQQPCVLYRFIWTASASSETDVLQNSVFCRYHRSNGLLNGRDRQGRPNACVVIDVRKQLHLLSMV